MEKVRQLLMSVSDSYYGFVIGMLDFASKNEETQNILINYIESHPEATTSDIIKYLCDNTDLLEDTVEEKKTVTAVKKENKMEKIKHMLLQVKDTYYDFVVTVLDFASKGEYRQNAIIKFLSENPDALSSDILKFMCDRTDFMIDAVSGNTTAV